MSNVFKTEKRGYSVAEVDAYIAESNAAVAAYRERIAELAAQLDRSNGEIAELREKEGLIARAIISAELRANEVENQIAEKYDAEVAHLTAFHDQWLGYYNKLIETYPLSGELGSLNEFNRRMSEILSGDGASDTKAREAEGQFEREKERLKRKYIGFIPVDGGADESGLGDEFSPDFNPEESIRQMLRRQTEEEQDGVSLKPANTYGKSDSKSAGQANSNVANSNFINEANSNGQSGAKDNQAKNGLFVKKMQPRPPVVVLGPDEQPPANGFSFEEALNPTQQLSDILKEIGLE